LLKVRIKVHVSIGVNGRAASGDALPTLYYTLGVPDSYASISGSTESSQRSLIETLPKRSATPKNSWRWMRRPDHNMASPSGMACIAANKGCCPGLRKADIDSTLSICYTSVMDTTDERDSDPLSQLSLSVFRLNGILMRNGDDMTKPIGQSSARWQVLGRAGYQPQTVAQMARNMGHARQSVQRVADALAREGLVAYQDNPSDKRARLLELTPKGADVLATIYSRYGAWSRHIMTKLDARQLATLAAALNEVADIVEADKRHSGAVARREM
jgi:DNA-binding MarR family transcriptional regulator